MDLRIHIDGGARGNPGPAGAGVVVHRADGGPVLEAGYYLGRATNNAAEYTALLRALAVAERLGAARLDIASDSELMVRQINGEYRVRNEGLKDLYAEAYERLNRFSNWRVRHVRREQNARADELANMAMDACEDVIVIDDTAGGEAPSRRRKISDPDGAPVGAKGRSSTAAAEERVSVVVTCTQPPDAAVCPAPCPADAKFEFTDVTPSGVCIHATPTLVEAVLAVRSASKPATASCPRRNCKARFDVR